MTTRRSFVLVVAAAAATAAAGIGVSLHQTSKAREAAAESFGIAVPPIGREVVLHVAWHEKTTVRPPKAEVGGLSDTMHGELDLDADLALARETTSDGSDAIRAELRDVKAARILVEGQPVIGGDDAARKSLAKRAVHLVVEDGRIVRVLVDRDAPSIAVQLTENLARQVLVPLPKSGGAAFERDEVVPAGTLHVAYAPKGGDAYSRNVVSAMSLDRLPDKCAGACKATAKGDGDVKFDEGVVVRFAEKRETRAGVPNSEAMLEAVSSIEATRASDGAIAGGAGLDTAKLASKLPGEPFESSADHRASLERLAVGASVADIVSGIAAAGVAGPKGLSKGWLVRSTAYLELHPEALPEIAIRFEDDGLGDHGRVALLDLLAATPSDEAKATLLRVLDSAAARQDAHRLEFVQRLVLVEDPSSAMARTMRDRFAQSRASGDAEMSYAEAHVLGSMANKLAAHGSRGEAKAASDALANALEQSKTPAATAAYLGALGNAGDPSQIARITQHAHDDDAQVRRAVASALRKTNDTSVKATLVSLAGDSDQEVQIAAVDSLGQQGANDPEAQRDLAHLLDSPRLGGEAEAEAVRLLLRQGPPSPEVRGSLEQLLARTEDPRLAARVRLALASSGMPN